MKTCTKCKENKSFDQYSKAKLGKFGLKAICKASQAKESSDLYIKNKEYILDYSKNYRDKNKESISIKRAIHTAKEHVKIRVALYGKQWRLDNPGKVNARTARRRACKRQATPKWLTEQQFKE